MNNMPILTIAGISKSFSSVEILKSVDFTLYSGEVHCLVGENGAGKSTLCKIIAGIYLPDGGKMQLQQHTYAPASVKDAQRLGIGFIHQELMLVPQLSVMENIFLGSEICDAPLGRMNWKAMRQKTHAIISELELGISPDDLIENLSTAQQQMVEIAKAMLHEYRILILDEPTASISKKNTETLFKIIRQLKAKGVAMIYISHRLEEFQFIADRVTVLRDGVRTGTMLYQDTNNNEIVKLMVGRDISADQQTHSSHQSEVVKLQIVGLRNHKFKPISFQVYQGEILGFAGLVGAGRTEVLRAIYAADFAEGQIYIDGVKQHITSPKQAVKAGIGFLTEDRKLQGLVLGQPIRKNITLPILTRFWNGWILDQNAEKQCVERNMQMLRIAASGQEQMAGTLSGGNQQKVILARWLESGTQILFFDEPTRGIDVGAKAEIYALMRGFTQQGGTIVMVSSDLPELLNMSDRIIVMRQGERVGEVKRADATEEGLMHMMVGI